MTELETLAKQLESEIHCDSGCEGRCRVCPEQVAKDATAALRKAEAELATMTAERDALKKHAEAMANEVIGTNMDKERYGALVDACYAYRAAHPKEPRFSEDGYRTEPEV